jgi:hypothetical protein
VIGHLDRLAHRVTFQPTTGPLVTQRSHWSNDREMA